MVQKSFCNPLPLPDYPVGLYVRKGVKLGYLNNGEPVSFRETADPSAKGSVYALKFPASRTS